ncbi:hypothetical protein R6Q57_003786 [Mikania cordata]
MMIRLVPFQSPPVQSPTKTICSSRNNTYIPFSRSRLDRIVKDPQLIQKSENDLAKRGAKGRGRESDTGFRRCEIVDRMLTWDLRNSQDEKAIEIKREVREYVLLPLNVKHLYTVVNQRIVKRLAAKHGSCPTSYRF